MFHIAANFIVTVLQPYNNKGKNSDSINVDGECWSRETVPRSKIDAWDSEDTFKQIDFYK